METNTEQITYRIYYSFLHSNCGCNNSGVRFQLAPMAEVKLLSVNIRHAASCCKQHRFSCRMIPHILLIITTFR